MVVDIISLVKEYLEACISCDCEPFDSSEHPSNKHLSTIVITPTYSTQQLPRKLSIMNPFSFDLSFDFSRTTKQDITFINADPFRPMYRWSNDDSSPITRDHSELIDERVRDGLAPNVLYSFDPRDRYGEHPSNRMDGDASKSRKEFPILDDKNSRDTYC